MKIDRHTVVIVAVLVIFGVLGWNRHGKNPIQRGGPSVPSNQGRTVGDDRSCIDLNSATAGELMTLPGVGKVTAAKIIEFRERHGPFRRPQDIIIIHGLSERKYRKVADFVCAR